MTKTRRCVKKSFLTKIATAAFTTMIVVAAVSVCTTALAQTNATVTIPESAHDYEAAASAPGYEVEGGVNYCEVCHGPPTTGSGPTWLHDELTPGTLDGTTWVYSNGAGGMTTGVRTDQCMGCHAGNPGAGTPVGPAIDDYDGKGAAGTLFITSSEAFGVDLSVHHPVDITYDNTTIPKGGLLEDPTTFLNPQGGGTIDATLLTGGKLSCNSCHEQHNDRRFDLAGGDPSDDPQAGGDPLFPPIGSSEAHDFLKINTTYLCFNCHVHDIPSGNKHHIPGRKDPTGDERASDINCTLCHNLTGLTPHPVSGAPTCESCHGLGSVSAGTAWGGGIGDRSVKGTKTNVNTNNHHGGDKDLPYFDCAMCHADPLTGILTGNDFGAAFAKSCYTCHDAIWEDGSVAPDDTPGDAAYTAPASLGPLAGVVDQTVTFDASAIVDEEGKPVAYQWDFGDGSLAQFPSHNPITTHTYTDFGTFSASLSWTDGVNAPKSMTFDVVISEATTTVIDSWQVTPSVDSFFDITFENTAGSLVGTQADGTLSFGVEFVGVIFWMEMWIDLNNSAFWGTGDVFFGNIDRDATSPTMTGVLFKADGTAVQTFGAIPTP